MGPGGVRKGDGGGEGDSSPEGDPREERLARAFSACLERIRAGEPLDLEEIAAAHPDLADDLLELLEAAIDLGIVLEGDGPKHADDG